DHQRQHLNLLNEFSVAAQDVEITQGGTVYRLLKPGSAKVKIDDADKRTVRLPSPHGFRNLEAADDARRPGLHARPLRDGKACGYGQQKGALQIRAGISFEMDRELVEQAHL